MEFQQEPSQISIYNVTEITEELFNDNTENTPETIFTCLGILYVLIGFAGFIGNGLVAYIFTR